MLSRSFGGAKIPLDAGDLLEQPQHSAGKAFRVGHAIGREPSAQVLGLAHVKHARIRTAQKINARRRGHSPEKVGAESFHQRSRRRPEPELRRALGPCDLGGVGSFGGRGLVHGLARDYCSGRFRQIQSSRTKRPFEQAQPEQLKAGAFRQKPSRKVSSNTARTPTPFPWIGTRIKTRVLPGDKGDQDCSPIGVNGTLDRRRPATRQVPWIHLLR